MKINKILNSRADYESPLTKLLHRQDQEKLKAQLENDYRLARQMLYRTDDRFFKSLLEKKDFRDRPSMIHGHFCFQHQLQLAEEADQEHYDNTALMTDPNFLFTLEKLHKGVKEHTEKLLKKNKRGGTSDHFPSAAKTNLSPAPGASASFKSQRKADGSLLKERIQNTLLGQVKAGATKIKAQKRLDGRVIREYKPRTAATPIRPFQHCPPQLENKLQMQRALNIREAEVSQDRSFLSQRRRDHANSFMQKATQESVDQYQRAYEITQRSERPMSYGKVKIPPQMMLSKGDDRTSPHSIAQQRDGEPFALALTTERQLEDSQHNAQLHFDVEHPKKPNTASQNRRPKVNVPAEGRRPVTQAHDFAHEYQLPEPRPSIPAARRPSTLGFRQIVSQRETGAATALLRTPHQQTNLFPLSGRFSVSTTQEMQKNLIQMMFRRQASQLRSATSAFSQDSTYRSNDGTASRLTGQIFSVTPPVNVKPEVSEFLKKEATTSPSRLGNLMTRANDILSEDVRSREEKMQSGQQQIDATSYDKIEKLKKQIETNNQRSFENIAGAQNTLKYMEEFTSNTFQRKLNQTILKKQLNHPKSQERAPTGGSGSIQPPSNIKLPDYQAVAKKQLAIPGNEYHFPMSEGTKMTTIQTNSHVSTHRSERKKSRENMYFGNKNTKSSSIRNIEPSADYVKSDDYQMSQQATTHLDHRIRSEHAEKNTHFDSKEVSQKHFESPKPTKAVVFRRTRKTIAPETQHQLIHEWEKANNKNQRSVDRKFQANTQVTTNAAATLESKAHASSRQVESDRTNPAQLRTKQEGGDYVTRLALKAQPIPSMRDREKDIKKKIQHRSAAKPVNTLFQNKRMSSVMEPSLEKTYQTEQIAPKDFITLNNSNMAHADGDTDKAQQLSKIDGDRDFFDGRLQDQLASIPIALAVGQMQPPFCRSTIKSQTDQDQEYQEAPNQSNPTQTSHRNLKLPRRDKLGEKELSQSQQYSSRSVLSLGSILKSSNDSCQDLEDKLMEPIDKEFKLIRVNDHRDQMNTIKSNLNMGLLSSLKEKMKAISSTQPSESGLPAASNPFEKMKYSLAAQPKGTARFSNDKGEEPLPKTALADLLAVPELQSKSRLLKSQTPAGGNGKVATSASQNLNDFQPNPKEWNIQKKLLKEKYTKAVHHMQDYSLKAQTKQLQEQRKNAEILKKYNYNGLGLEKEECRDPLYFELPKKKQSQSKSQSPTKKDNKEQKDQGGDKNLMTQTQVQEKNMIFFRNLFQYWCKKKTSKYLRIHDFYRYMVIFGLAPNQQMVEQLIQEFDKQIKKPVVSSVETFISPQKLHVQSEFRSQKPFNKYFTYKVNDQGLLEISHISFDTLQEIYKTNKHIAALQEYITGRLQQKYAKLLKENLLKINSSVSQQDQTKQSKKQSFSVQEFMTEIQLVWGQIDHNDVNYITKQRFYKFLAENKIQQNPDMQKAEEFLKAVIVDWGVADSANENRQKELKVQINEEFESKYKGQNKRFAPSKPAASFDKIEYIQKSLFERMFLKTIFVIALSNSVKLMDMIQDARSQSRQSENSHGPSLARSRKETDDQSLNDNDKLWQTLNAIIYQRNFLYSMFEVRRPERKRRNTIAEHAGLALDAMQQVDVLKYQQAGKAPNTSSAEEMRASLAGKDSVVNPYMLQFLMNPKAQAQSNLSKLKAQPMDAIEKLDEFAKKNPFFDRELVEAECQQQIQQLKAQKKQQDMERRKQAKIAALEQGFRLEEFNFYDEETLKKFAPRQGEASQPCLTESDLSVTRLNTE